MKFGGVMTGQVPGVAVPSVWRPVSDTISSPALTDFALLRILLSFQIPALSSFYYLLPLY